MFQCDEKSPPAGTIEMSCVQWATEAQTGCNTCRQAVMAVQFHVRQRQVCSLTVRPLHTASRVREISALPVLNAYAQGKANALTSILLTDRNAWKVVRRGDAQSELVLRTASKSRLLGRFDQTCSATDGLAAAHSWTA